MKPLLQKVFMSSAGNGNISQFWKGFLVIGVGMAFPEAAESDILSIVEQIIVTAGSVWALYGLVMKMFRGRWSALPQ